jgi:hypothetical protein
MLRESVRLWSGSLAPASRPRFVRVAHSIASHAPNVDEGIAIHKAGGFVKDQFAVAYRSISGFAGRVLTATESTGGISLEPRAADAETK